jgi:hypothetical protein
MTSEHHTRATTEFGATTADQRLAQQPKLHAETLCKHCELPILLPGDRVSFATLDGDRRCGWSPFGWHDSY